MDLAGVAKQNDVVPGTGSRRVASHAGTQSSAQPSSDWRVPTRVTESGTAVWSAAAGDGTTARAEAETSRPRTAAKGVRTKNSREVEQVDVADITLAGH